MTTGPDVDWAEVERRGRRSDWMTLPLLVVLLAALVTLQGRWASWAGTGAWVAVGVLATLVAVGHLVVLLAPGCASGRRRPTGCTTPSVTGSTRARSCAVGLLLGAQWDSDAGSRGPGGGSRNRRGLLATYRHPADASAG